MFALRRFLLRLFTFFRSSRAETELACEINAHLQLLEDKFRAQGMTAEDARFAARRAFGGVEQAKEHQRDTRSFRWLDDSWLDLKLGARMLVKYPGLSIIGGVGLAGAIAIGTGSFAFFNAYLYSTLPVEEGERIVAVENWDTKINNEERQSLHDFLMWRQDLKSVENLGAFAHVERNLIVPGGSVELIRIAQVTASGFRMTRVPPVRGRPLLDEDERIGAANVLVIGSDVWQSRFGNDPDVVGREVRIGNTRHTIVGVMPAGYAFPVNDSYWVPLRLDPSGYERGQGPTLFVFGRLAPGVTLTAAQAELTTLGARTASMFPASNAHLEPRVMPYAYPILDIQGTSLWEVAVMQATVSLLLVIVALNVAILVYARTATRQGEIAVRTALGASRRRIVGQLFTEALVLSGVAAVVGFVIAKVGISRAHLIMQMESARPPYWIDYGLSAGAVLYVVAMVVFAAIIAGVLPALHATGRRVQSTLRELGGSSGLRLGGTWTLLIVTQVALTVAALPMAVTIGWNEVRHAATQPSFAAEDFLAVRFAMDPEPPPGMDAATYQAERVSQALKVRTELVARVQNESWVAGVTSAMTAPDLEPSAAIDVEGVAVDGGAPSVRSNRVAVNFFATFGAQILAGRPLSTADVGGDGGILVNRAFVQQVLHNGNALGRRVRYVQSDEPSAEQVRGQWYEIVGVVSDLQVNFITPEAVRPALFHAGALENALQRSVLLRVRGGAATIYGGRVREIAASIDPTVRTSTMPLTNLYRQASVAFQLVGIVLGLIIISVLLLSAAGIYALMSFTVAQRRKEIGIRAAMGADSRRLLAAIFSRSARQLASGVAVGIASALGLDALSDGALLGAEGRIFLPIMSVVMATVGLLAALGPARRGLKIQPTQALRDQ